MGTKQPERAQGLNSGALGKVSFLLCPGCNAAAELWLQTLPASAGALLPRDSSSRCARLGGQLLLSLSLFTARFRAAASGRVPRQLPASLRYLAAPAPLPPRENTSASPLLPGLICLRTPGMTAAVNYKVVAGVFKGWEPMGERGQGAPGCLGSCPRPGLTPEHRRAIGTVRTSL